MSTAELWDAAMLVTTAAHAGFQLTVSCLVYPALAAVPPQSWDQAHRQHSRRIAPVVVVVYLPVLATSARLLAVRPSRSAVVSAAASGVAFGLTAAGAAPLHRRLGRGHDRAVLRRLLWVDRARSVAAVVSAAAATAS